VQVSGSVRRREQEQSGGEVERSAPDVLMGPAPPVQLVQQLQRGAGNRATVGALRGASPAGGRTLARMYLPWINPMLLPTFWLASQGLPKASAPAWVVLPKAFEEGLTKAWGKSLPGKKSKEQGGILVQNAKGEYKWKPGKKSTSGTFSINYKDVKKGETLVASAHTHPYSKKEGGFTDVAFSGGDMANFVTGTERIKVVRSGTGEFMIAKSKEWDDDVKARNATQIDDLKKDIKKTWQDAFDAASGDMPEQSQEAAKAVAKKFNLLFYSGSGGVLTMPADLLPTP
jgi:hypothetical protein